ncbi:hypothetical protein B0H12DRAFT_1329459 [Mycena haematopus]|nr:hypothetical protein B0H12DRAFT_1329459 [Mycena haematopus]
MPNNQPTLPTIVFPVGRDVARRRDMVSDVESTIERTILASQAVAAPDESSFAAITPGKYKIRSEAFGVKPIRSHLLLRNQPIFVWRSLISAGQFEEWMIEQCGSSQTYKISNVGLKAPTYVSEGLVLAGNKQAGDCFYFERVGYNSFVIRVPEQDKVWTIGDPTVWRATVQLKPQEFNDSELWNLAKVEGK